MFSLEFRQSKDLISYLSNNRKRQLVIIAILMIIASLSEVASISLVIPFLGALTAPETIYQNQFFSPFIDYFNIESPEQLLLPFTIIFIIAVVSSATIRLLLLYVTVRFSHAAGHDLGANVYRKILYQSYSYHSNQNSSDVINGVVLKVNIITGGVIKPILTITSSVLLMVGIVGALIFIDIYTSLIAFASFALIYITVIRLTRNKIRDNSRNIANYSTLVIKSLQEGLGGIRDVLIDGTQNFFCKIYKNADIPMRKASGDNNIIAGSPRFIMEALGMTLIAILAYSLTINSKV